MFSSRAETRADGRLGPLTQVLRKSSAVRELRGQYDRVVCIGEGFNDLPMFEEADLGVAYGGVHAPARELIDNAAYVVGEGDTLCRLLHTL